MASALIDLLLPERCAACGRAGAGFCATCRQAAEALRLPGGRPTRLAPDVIAVAAFRYDGVVAAAIRDLKVPGRHAAAVPLARILWSVVGAYAPPWPRTWVPSTRTRRRRRGADVPRILAGPGAVGLLRRVRQDSDQTALTAAGRRVARQRDFVSRHRVPLRVVLVDDVRTTGGTVLAAAAALRSAGARRMVVLTLAAVDDPGTHTDRTFPLDSYEA